jgi:tRNA dimethylallyltransferase
LRAELEALEDAEPGALLARLQRLDPVAADRLHPNDRLRLIRAIEVAERTGTPMSTWQQAHGFRAAELAVRVVGLDLERRRLYARLDARCRSMIEHGLLDESRALGARGYGPELAPLRSIGYRELGAHLRGECGFDAALAAMQRATRQLAKRQLTWFRADSSVEWLDAERATSENIVQRHPFPEG